MTRFLLRIAMIALALAPVCLDAQTKTNKVTVLDGPENDTKRSSVLGMFGYDQTGYYTMRYEKKKILVEHLNGSMTVDKSVEREELSVGKEDLGFLAAVQLEEKFYFLYTLHDSKTKVVTLYYKNFNRSTLMTEGELHEMASETFVSTRSFMQKAAFAYFSPFTALASEDKTRLLLITRNSTGAEESEEGSQIEMKLTVFDSEMKKEWDLDAKTGFNSDLFSVTNIRLDDNGDVSIVGVEYKEKLTNKQLRRNEKPQYTHHLIRYTEQGSKMMSMPIELNGKFITDLRIETAPSGDIVVAGFYSEKGSFSIKGAFYLSIDPVTETIKAQEFSEFGTEFITLNFTDREEKKAKKKEDKGEELEMNEFDMRDLILKGDGGATLIAEQYIFYVTSHTTYSNGKSSTTYVYHYLYNDIIVVSFGNTGELLWKTKIPKRQHTTNDGGMWSSYAMAVVGDKLFFIFNDNPKNLFLGKDEAPYSFAGSRDLAVVLVEVDAEGKATKELLFTTERGDAMVRPKIAEQTGENEMVICSQRSKIFQYSKLTFK